MKPKVVENYSYVDLPFTPGIGNGRYVTILNLGTTRALGFMEVEVWSIVNGVLTNVAVGKTVTGSEVAAGGYAFSQLVDGLYDSAHATSTPWVGTKSSWLQIDLGSAMLVSGIVLYTIQGFSGEALGSSVVISNTAYTDGLSTADDSVWRKSVVWQSNVIASKTGSTSWVGDDSGYPIYVMTLPSSDAKGYYFMPIAHVPNASTVTGRYVHLTHTSYLSFVELQVWSNGVNVALGKKVTNSVNIGDTHSMPASNLVDGTTSAIVYDTLTAGTKMAIMVDLGVDMPIENVVLYTRRDCCLTAVNNTVISIRKDFVGSSDILTNVSSGDTSNRLTGYWLGSEHLGGGYADLDWRHMMGCSLDAWCQWMTIAPTGYAYTGSGWVQNDGSNPSCAMYKSGASDQLACDALHPTPDSLLVWSSGPVNPGSSDSQVAYFINTTADTNGISPTGKDRISWDMSIILSNPTFVVDPTNTFQSWVTPQSGMTTSMLVAGALVNIVTDLTKASTSIKPYLKRFCVSNGVASPYDGVDITACSTFFYSIPYIPLPPPMPVQKYIDPTNTNTITFTSRDTVGCNDLGPQVFGLENAPKATAFNCPSGQIKCTFDGGCGGETCPGNCSGKCIKCSGGFLTSITNTCPSLGGTGAVALATVNSDGSSYNPATVSCTYKTDDLVNNTTEVSGVHATDLTTINAKFSNADDFVADNGLNMLQWCLNYPPYDFRTCYGYWLTADQEKRRRYFLTASNQSSVAKTIIANFCTTTTTPARAFMDVCIDGAAGPCINTANATVTSLSNTTCDNSFKAYCATKIGANADPNDFENNKVLCGCYYPQPIYTAALSQFQAQLSNDSSVIPDHPYCYFNDCSTTNVAVKSGQCTQNIQACFQNVHLEVDGSTIGNLTLNQGCTLKSESTDGSVCTPACAVNQTCKQGVCTSSTCTPACASGQTCVNEVCTSTCTADCTGKCGGVSDGCSGTCNTACTETSSSSLVMPIAIGVVVILAVGVFMWWKDRKK